MADPFTALKRVLHERIDQLQQELAMGNAEDHAAYKATCGEIAGIKYAISELEHLRSRYEVD